MRTILFIISAIFFISCGKDAAQKKQSTTKSKLSIVEKHQVTESLEKLSTEKVIDWKEYNALQAHLNQFSSISAHEALNNALVLAKLVKQLKDSIRPTELLNPSFRTRVNVLENEALRLKDMTFLLNAIKAQEVNLQVDKILEAFSATNSKINSIYTQLEIDKEILIKETTGIKQEDF